MTAGQIVAKSWELYRQVSDEKEIFEIEVTQSNGRREEKTFTRWTKYDAGKSEDKITVKFSKPAMDEGLGLLTWRHPDRSDDQWLKLPSLDRVRRISVSDQDKYFAGTDLTYEDTRQLVGERLKDFDYRLLKKEGEQWIIEALPKAGTETGYSKRIFRIDGRFAFIKIEYYAKDGKHLKTQTNSQLVYEKNGLWRTGLILLNNHLLNRKTSIKTVDRKLNNGFSSDYFSQKFLESRQK